MNWFHKLFGKGDGKSAKISLQKIRFGHYSDNNKPQAQLNRWGDAQEAFKAKKYGDSFGAFFDYIRDNRENNVQYTIEGQRFTFELIQGRKKIFGRCDGRQITVEAHIAKMNVPGTAVMRRLLELNHRLNYSRAAMDEGHKLSILFDTPVETTTPNKLYNGLKEMAIKANDLSGTLPGDSDSLEWIHEARVEPVAEKELEVKYNYFRESIEVALETVKDLNPDSFSGAVQSCLFATIYRIDYLISPKGSLMATLEKMSLIHDETRPIVETNRRILEELKKLLNISKEEFTRSIYRTKSTFALLDPVDPATARGYIEHSIDLTKWYIQNNYDHLALFAHEFGMSANQFHFSMPSFFTELYHVYMMVIHSRYFADLGWKQKLYDLDKDKFDKGTIRKRIQTIIRKNRDEYPNLNFDVNALKFDDINNFGLSYLNQMANLDYSSAKN